MPQVIELETLVYREIPEAYLSALEKQPRPPGKVTYRDALMGCVRDRETVDFLNGKLAAIRRLQLE